MTLLTPGPVRWKSWMFDRSCTTNLYVPGLAVVTFAPEEFVRPMVNDGPTLPFSVMVAVGAPLAWPASAAVISAAMAPIVIRFFIEAPLVDLRGLRWQFR